MPAAPSSPAFRDFAAALAGALSALAGQGRSPDIAFDPTRDAAVAPNEVLVGVGAWMRAGEPVAQTGIVLNQKGAWARFPGARAYDTASRFAGSPPPEELDRWRALHGTLSPAQALDRLAFVVEDASPDSTLAVVLFLARLAGLSEDDLPHRWLETTLVWEREGSAADAHRSWTSLLSALSHSYMSSESRQDRIVAAWVDALGFTASLMAAGVDPDAVDPQSVPGLLADRGYARAIAFLNGERQDYLQSLARATRVELRVPMAGAPERSLLVDGYFAVEPTHPSGVKKVFIRNDRENSTLGGGFAIMGLYRPGLEGTGYDVTVSCDPRAGVDLKDLWARLEALETQAWEGARPDDAPRLIESYRGHRGFNQPWWDDSGRYTILGAPKKLADGRLGSRLGWTDVLEAVWACYQPLKGIEVFDLNAGRASGTVQIGALSARKVASAADAARADKRLIAAKWDRRATSSMAIQFTPTVLRVFAAMVERAAAGEAGMPKLGDLVDPRDFQHVEFSGGSAVVTRDGAFLFDDWRETDLDTATLSSDFAAAVDLLAQVRAFDAEVDALYETATVESERLFRGASHGAILKRITSLRARIARAFQRADVMQGSLDRRSFRAALEAWWGLEAKESQLTTRLKDLQEILETAATLRTQGMAQLIGFVAVPAFVVSTLALFTTALSNLAARVGWEGDLGYVGVTALVILALSAVAFAVAAAAARRGG